MGQEGSHLRSRLPFLLLISGSAMNIFGNSTLRDMALWKRWYQFSCIGQWGRRSGSDNRIVKYSRAECLFSIIHQSCCCNGVYFSYYPRIRVQSTTSGLTASACGLGMDASCCGEAKRSRRQSFVLAPPHQHGRLSGRMKQGCGCALE